MACSYSDNWATDSPFISPSCGPDLMDCMCEYNPVLDVRLKPGEKYERDLWLEISDKAKPGLISFKLGFFNINPFREEKLIAGTFWSNPILVKIQKE